MYLLTDTWTATLLPTIKRPKGSVGSSAIWNLPFGSTYFTRTIFRTKNWIGVISSFSVSSWPTTFMSLVSTGGCRIISCRSRWAGNFLRPPFFRIFLFLTTATSTCVSVASSDSPASFDLSPNIFNWSGNCAGTNLSDLLPLIIRFICSISSFNAAIWRSLSSSNWTNSAWLKWP